LSHVKRSRLVDSAVVSARIHSISIRAAVASPYQDQKWRHRSWPKVKNISAGTLRRSRRSSCRDWDLRLCGLRVDSNRMKIGIRMALGVQRRHVMRLILVREHVSTAGLDIGTFRTFGFLTRLMARCSTALATVTATFEQWRCGFSGGVIDATFPPSRNARSIPHDRSLR